jgi:hypothetical protein
MPWDGYQQQSLRHDEEVSRTVSMYQLPRSASIFSPGGASMSGNGSLGSQSVGRLSSIVSPASVIATQDASEEPCEEGTKRKGSRCM